MEKKQCYILAVAMIVVFITIAVVVGAPNLKDNPHHQEILDRVDKVNTLINCKTSLQYQNLSSFKFNPRNVAFEDTACLSLQMFQEMGFIHHFDIPVEILSRFILRTQRGYQEVPYHNWSHGFSVLHFSFAVLKNCNPIEKHHFTPLEGLALLTAAMCHDVDHPGTNNQFQIETKSTLAQSYGELGSILERHHIAVTFGFLKNAETNFIAHLTEDENKQFMDIIKQIILATDLSTHFKVLKDETQMAESGFDEHSQRHRELLKSIIITCADLGDQSKDWLSVRNVAKLIYTEFFDQGDQEKNLGLVPTTMMDRKQAQIPQSQVDFLSNVVLPVFKLLLILYPETQVCTDNMQKNLIYWRKSIPYFEEQIAQGRNSLDIISDTRLDSIFYWKREE